MCTTQHRLLDNNERIQHTLNVYSKNQTTGDVGAVDEEYGG